MQILATIGSGVLGGAGVEFPTIPLTSAVAQSVINFYQLTISSHHHQQSNISLLDFIKIVQKGRNIH